MGHLLGSACIEIWLSEGGERRKIVFSGDVGNVNQPLLRDPQTVSGADYVVCESTYGDRLHEKVRTDYVTELARVIQRVFDRGGNVVIPSFAVGRTQEMLYFIREIKERGLVTGTTASGSMWTARSPWRRRASSSSADTSFLDDEARAILARGVNPLAFDGLEVSVSVDESRAINENTESKVIISASGMCGRRAHTPPHKAQPVAVRVPRALRRLIRPRARWAGCSPTEWTPSSSSARPSP